MSVQDRIRDLQHQLFQLGYYDFQVREIILEAGGREDLRRLNPEEAERVAVRLAEQVAFARECLQMGRLDR